jgi:hypothetical protein
VRTNRNSYATIDAPEVVIMIIRITSNNNNQGQRHATCNKNVFFAQNYLIFENHHAADKIGI